MPDAEPEFPRLDLDTISMASGPWVIDEARARRDARTVLAAIDFSRRDIVIWVPGTNYSGVRPAFRRALRAAQVGAGDGGGDRASLTALLYEGSWHIRRSLPTGMATLKLVLQGVARRLESSSTEHAIYLAGESQGAWIIGEIVADAEVGPLVTRAVLMGHPFVAGHKYGDGQDERVAVINNEGDQVTLGFRGEPSHGLDAMIALRTLQLSRGLSRHVRALGTNLDHVGRMLLSIGYYVPRIRECLRNPHNYNVDMPRAVDFLYTGELRAGEEWVKPDPIAVAHGLAPKLGPKLTPHVAKVIA
ncbi:MAG: hypothetical protein JWN41_724, partial [Thermoleophilia bacterium]|nr:hypothetical protein [Thermoleophilia bacterium]